MAGGDGAKKEPVLKKKRKREAFLVVYSERNNDARSILEILF